MSNYGIKTIRFTLDIFLEDLDTSCEEIISDFLDGGIPNVDWFNNGQIECVRDKETLFEIVCPEGRLSDLTSAPLRDDIRGLEEMIAISQTDIDLYESKIAELRAKLAKIEEGGGV